MDASELQASIKERIAEEDVRNIRLVFCNASGVPCAKVWSSSHYDDLVRNGIDIFKGNYFMCLGISPPPKSRFKIDAGDLNLVPDFDTFAVLPYVPSTGRLYGDLHDKDTGQPWECCARSLLKKMIANLKDEGYVCDTAGELEFYLTRRDLATNKIARLYGGNEAPPFSTLGLDLVAPFLDEAVSNLRSCGLDVTRIVKEGGPGQYEINLMHSEGVRPVDDIVTLREVIKGTALRHNLNATFMPKPFSGELGSGMHIHQSLRDEKTGKKNLFSSESGMSALGYQYVGGIMRHGAALCAVAAPTVNSYKRLRPGWVAVDELKQGVEDRGAAVRIPKLSNGSGRGFARIEYRVSDAASNPYLLVACLIAAGLDGIKRSIDIKETGPEPRLPKSLEEALAAFKQDQFFSDLLGQTYFEEYVKLKEYELEIFNQQVSEFELDKYGYAF